jgi:hypothetical protein
MSRSWILGLAALMAAAACGRQALSPADGPAAPSRGAPMQGGVRVDSGATTIDGSGTVADAEVNVAPIDASTLADVSLTTDGGRVPYHAIEVVTGEDHACALLDDHRMKCWGNNDWGQLGYGDSRTRGGSPSDMGDALPTVDLGTGRTAVTIAAGRDATCAILDDGSLKCWGMPMLNGTGTSNNVGDEPGEMGDNLSPLDFGGRKAVNVAIGWGVACASMDDDSLWCWALDLVVGDSGKPSQLMGLPVKRVSALAPASGGTVALYDDGTLSPFLPNGSAPLTFMSDGKIVAVAGASGDPTCVLFDDATTACLDGIGQSSGPKNVVAIGAEASGGWCVALPDGDAQCQAAQCAPPYQCSSDDTFTFGAPAAAVTSGGSAFACALLADGNIKCWSQQCYPTGCTDSPPTRPELGAEFDVLTTQPDGGVVYGPWHAVDLGAH